MESNPTFYSPSGNDAPAPPSGDRHAGSTPSVILRTIRTVFFFRPPPLSVGCAKNLHLCRRRIILFETLYRLKRPPSMKGIIRP